MIEQFIVYALALILVITALTILMATIIIARRKVRKEIGLFLQHLAYRPARPKKNLHFEDYGKEQQPHD